MRGTDSAVITGMNASAFTTRGALLRASEDDMTVAQPSMIAALAPQDDAESLGLYAFFK